MMTTNDDALYTLRNLTVGDDEQTRIADLRASVAPDVRALIDAGRFDDACRAFILSSSLVTMTRDELTATIADWTFDFCFCEGGDDDDDPNSHITLATDMLATFDSLR